MRKTILLAAVVAMGLSSCSKNEVTEISAPSDNINRIGISTGVGTTRGTDMVTSSLQANDIILSYADSSTTPNSGTLTFTYNTTDSEWNDNSAGTKWSELTLPAAFNSFINDKIENLAVTGGSGKATSLANDYTVSDPNPENHNDLLYMSEVVSAVPAGGKIYSTFKHALSKVDLISITGSNIVVGNYIAFKNMNSTGNVELKADIITPTLTWTTTDGLPIDYESLNREVALTAEHKPKVLINNAIISNIGETTNSATANMKLIPQTISGDYNEMQAAIKAAINSVESNNNLANADYSNFKYIEVLYRMTSANSQRIVGFENAANYPNFDKLDKDVQDKYNGKPLFIKAAFVLSNELTLKPSSYYKLNLNFNTFGGLLIDDCYYDQNGDRTEFKVVADIEPGDPIIPSDDTVIGITVVMDDWTTESDTDME